MEFILNNKRYSIQDHELLVNYLIVDSYFRQGYSLYDYDIEFEFINPLLEKEKIEFEDLLDQTNVLMELIEKEKVSFIPNGLIIIQNSDESFNIAYQDLEFGDVNIGEAIPLIIALNTLLTYKPIVTLAQIEEELDNFLEKFRSYAHQ